VGDKGKRNFCDELEFSGKNVNGKAPGSDMDQKWKDLFKN
jgi:hypothetical protein